MHMRKRACACAHLPARSIDLGRRRLHFILPAVLDPRTPERRRRRQLHPRAVLSAVDWPEPSQRRASGAVDGVLLAQHRALVQRQRIVAFLPGESILRSVYHPKRPLDRLGGWLVLVGRIGARDRTAVRLQGPRPACRPPLPNLLDAAQAGAARAA